MFVRSFVKNEYQYCLNASLKTPVENATLKTPVCGASLSHQYCLPAMQYYFFKKKGNLYSLKKNFHSHKDFDIACNQVCGVCKEKCRSFQHLKM